MIRAIFLLFAFFCSMHAAAAPFQIKVKTDNLGFSNSTSFVLPLLLGEPYDCTIDWGDGTNQDITGFGGLVSHTYPVTGTYTITITEKTLTGGFPGIWFDNSGDKLKLLELISWGSVHWTSFNNAFAGCENLVITATDHATANTGNVSDFRFAWLGCSSLTSFPLINTASGMDFYAAWADCSNLTSFPRINTAAGTDFSLAWFRCSSLTSFPEIDTATGTVFQGAWKGCSSLTSFPPINTAKGTQFVETWSGCSSLTSFPLIDTAKGTNFLMTWFGCSSLTSFPPINTAAGSNFANAWQGCGSLTSFPRINTAAGTSFNSAWAGCGSLTSFPRINTAAGTSFNSAWIGCISLTSFPLIDTAKGTNFALAWADCSSLVSFPRINTAAGTDFRSAWARCSSLTNFPVLDLSSMDQGAGCFGDVPLPTATYSALLADLAARNTNTVVTFDGGFSRYNSSGATARATLTGAKSWTITDGGPAIPIITSPSAASIETGTAFTYSITASDNPTSFDAMGMPSPLTRTNNVISGSTSTLAGTYPITISATNSQGTGSATLTLYVNAAGAPVITSSSTAGGIRGQPITTYQITATNSPTSWDAVGLPPGLTCNTSTGTITGTPTVIGATKVSLRATNAGTGVATLTITIATPGGSSGSGGGEGDEGGSCGAGALSAMLLVLFACLGFRRQVDTRMGCEHS